MEEERNICDKSLGENHNKQMEYTNMIDQKINQKVNLACIFKRSPKPHLTDTVMPVQPTVQKACLEAILYFVSSKHGDLHA